ncbi:DUF799 domain-containing protein [Flavobacteriaceae bacterium]|jgi:hypothetical protein|nr:DUF799 domain-containing protein [Flavobacteriaceae bacterium]|tara:strand:+ start:522 stop:1199 length:678 start_codon:yes stop_codon:yes gene_type:complete
MKYSIYLLLSATFFIFGCGTTSKLNKVQAYKGMYEEKPLSVLIMPPINRSTNVEAKEYFYTTLNVPILNAGYYVIPPFLSMEILKRESAYDSELFIERPSLKIFNNIFGADIILFTIINKWDKSSIGSKVTVEVEYILKSTHTNEILYSRKGTISYNTSISSGGGALLNILASVANTAATKYVEVAKAANNYIFTDLPKGKYSPMFGLDKEEMAGLKVIKVRLPK